MRPHETPESGTLVFKGSRIHSFLSRAAIPVGRLKEGAGETQDNNPFAVPEPAIGMALNFEGNQEGRVDLEIGGGAFICPAHPVDSPTQEMHFTPDGAT